VFNLTIIDEGNIFENEKIRIFRYWDIRCDDLELEMENNNYIVDDANEEIMYEHKSYEGIFNILEIIIEKINTNEQRIYQQSNSR
jgi:hypothetical protein